jgi:hypothetical protein
MALTTNRFTSSFSLTLHKYATKCNEGPEFHLSHHQASVAAALYTHNREVFGCNLEVGNSSTDEGVSWFYPVTLDASWEIT